MDKVEGCYKTLNKEGFWKGNDLQTLAHILALGEEDAEVKCKKAHRLYNKLKEEKCKLQYSALATLGVLTLITSDEDRIVRWTHNFNFYNTCMGNYFYIYENYFKRFYAR